MLHTILSISGASGSGKSTLERCITQHFGGGKVRTVTTREPRPGETEQDYCFEAVAALERRDDVLWQVETHNACYAAVFSEFERAARESGGVVCIAVTPEGHELVSTHFEHQGIRCVRVHLEHPGDAVLRERLARRGLDPAAIDRRIDDSRVFEEEVDRMGGVHTIPNTDAAAQCVYVLQLLNQS